MKFTWIQEREREREIVWKAPRSRSLDHAESRKGVEMFLCIAVFEKRHGALEKGTEGITEVFVLPKRVSFPSCF